jgi:hypothetical protein
MTRTICLVGVLLLAAAAPAQSPLSYVQPPPAPPPLAPDPPPLLGDAPPPGPGLYFGAEVSVVRPSLNFHLGNSMPLGFPGRTLDVPDVSLPWTVSPTFEIGYRLPEGGAFALSYRFLVAEGTGTVEDASVRTRLNMQVFDLDYVFAPIEIAPRYELTARLGGRLADVFFDSRAVNATTLGQSSNDFFGAGVHGRLELERRIVLVPGLGVFGRVDGSVLIGQGRQRFRLEEGGIVSTMRQRAQQTVPTVNAQAGLSYAPPGLPGVKFATGYEYEQYFDVGGVNPSSGDVYWHGWFLRARIDF